MSKLECAGVIGIVFMSGVVASNNLSRLIDTSAAYQASWYKFGMSIIIAVVCALVVVNNYKNKN